MTDYDIVCEVVLPFCCCCYFPFIPLQRRASLRPYVCDSPYNKQKDNLRLDFEKFLSARSVCPPPCATAPSMATASPLDVLRFLHFRSKNGRTQVHVFACSAFGRSGLHECGCPRMFAAATVDSYVGMLRALFNDIGRRLHHNPCDLVDVKSWV